MIDIVVKIRAAIDEDERMARAAIPASGGAEWYASDSGSGIYPEDNPSQHPGPFIADAYGYLDPDYGLHIARHDPARVLRQVAVMRKILDYAERLDDYAVRNNEWAVPSTTDVEEALAEVYGIEVE